MDSHELQHSDSPTWCIHCGTFDNRLGATCDAPRTAEYDSRNLQTARRMMTDLLGLKPESPEEGR